MACALLDTIGWFARDIELYDQLALSCLATTPENSIDEASLYAGSRTASLGEAETDAYRAIVCSAARISRTSRRQASRHFR